MKSWKYIFAVLFLLLALIWLAVLVFPENNLSLVACNVGQGDAVLAVYGNTQMLIDGGPNSKVLDCLSKYLPFWDRELELVILTHPQADHFKGLIDVFKRYEIDTFLVDGLDVSTPEYDVLKNQVTGSGAQVVNPTKGMVFRLGLIYLDVLWPTQEYLTRNTEKIDSLASGVLGAYTSNRDSNELSIVAVLRFKDFNALLTGDMSPEVSDVIAEELRQSGIQSIDYIKIPHHGSKNGLTSKLLEVARPAVAVISVGKNSYGHPHDEIINLLRDEEVKILRTDEIGDVEVISNGEKYWLKN